MERRARYVSQRRERRTKLTLVVGVLALTACSRGGLSGAGANEKADLNAIERADWGAHYDMLHPAQAKLVDRALFIKCQQTGSPGSVVLKDIRIISEAPEANSPVPGTDIVADSVVVTVELTMNGTPAKMAPHEFNVGGKWYWIADAESMGAYRAGKCP